MGVRAKKHLGQHFLKDENIASRIADSLSLEGYQHVLEIGPGMGVLTKFLLKKNCKVWVVEIDTESIDYLKNHYLHLSDRMFSEDFLKMNLPEVFHGEPLAVIGNFPYNISSQIVFKTLENREYIPEFSGMFQKEVAQRIAAGPGSKTYGILSVLTQAFYDVSYLFTVPPSVFDPPPKVDSGVIRLTRKDDFKLPVDETFFFKVVKTAFNQRRKTLRNSLKSFQISDKLKEDVIFALRPEQLSVQQFVELSKSLAKDGIRDQQ
jgi:16S rRNA (adenine1518-N6/adenine1519-N6)-dimethyltransferase